MNAFLDRSLRALCACAVCASVLALPGVGPARAQGGFQIYGNFCGPGNRGPGYPPIDALDLACAHHDACSPGIQSQVLPRCSCNRRLQVEASLVARDPRAPPETRDMAGFISNWAGSAPCQ